MGAVLSLRVLSLLFPLLDFPFLPETPFLCHQGLLNSAFRSVIKSLGTRQDLGFRPSFGFRQSDFGFATLPALFLCFRAPLARKLEGLDSFWHERL